MTWLRRHFGTLLLVALVAGCVFLGAVLALRILGGFQSTTTSEPALGFPGILRSADQILDLLAANPTDQPLRERLLRILDDALDDIVSVEAELSVLKRHRRLALMDASYGDHYARSAVEASGRFPQSGTLAAVAGEALLFHPSITKAGQAPVPQIIIERIMAADTATGVHYAGQSNDAGAGYAVLAAALAFKDPAYSSMRDASAFAWTASMLEATSDVYLRHGLGDGESAAVDASLMRVLSDDALGARKLMEARIKPIQSPSDGTIRFLAELEYDFGDKRLAASYFTRLGSYLGLARAADALWLAGDVDSAREAWKQLAGMQEIVVRNSVTAALFNLARSSLNPEEAFSWAARLHAFNPEHAPGIILFVRLNASSGINRALSSTGPASDDTLMDLERLKLAAIVYDVQRTTAQSWLLMNKRPGESRIAEWVAWFLTMHSIRTEAAILAAKHATLEPVPSWLHNLKGFIAATSGQLDEAETDFEKASSTGGDWRLAANLALVSEMKRQYGKALERYRIAASLKPPPADAARIQLRIARTLVSLGMREEAVKELEYGLYLDPLNGDLRYELKKATLR